MRFAATSLCVVVLLSAFSVAAAPLTPQTVWTPEARAAAPQWVQLWILFMFAVTGVGLLLVWKHRMAWWMVGAFIASHIASGLEILLLGPERLTVGLIALNHCVFWTPAAVVFYRRTRGTGAATLFGGWRWVALATTAFSLVFDFRDAALFLLFTGSGTS